MAAIARMARSYGRAWGWTIYSLSFPRTLESSPMHIGTDLSVRAAHPTWGIQLP
ncbi:hypothetical protein [Zestomonas carbonaria]|uniref:Uncharacterized protein n=1 Tax=Zestomonas carbonaria TaxID=2762745 RepID=A0A7U7EM32_9GAMM|nr:hypothetical protein [Pseudomonas carbonaria]CAD5107528.1 hypothetical protein PSEWESI4_01801 [Pseudomonas carbonaria]